MVNGAVIFKIYQLHKPSVLYLKIATQH